MGSSTLITDYLGYGPAADKPTAPALPSGCLGFYYASDAGQVWVWDGAWQTWTMPGQTFSGSLTAAGTSQATATTVTANVNLFTTVTAGSGAVLSAGAIGAWQKVMNKGAAALLVYPPAGGTIDANAENEAVTIVAGGVATFWVNTTTQWYSE